MHVASKRCAEPSMLVTVIEREIPGAGKLSPNDLKAISQKSCGVLRNMGPQIQWVHSYVTDDKIYCVYVAPNEAAVLEIVAELGGVGQVAVVGHGDLAARAVHGERLRVADV